MALTPSITDKLLKVGQPIATTTLDSPGYTQNQTGPMTVISTNGWPTDTQTVFAMDRVTTVTENGVTKTVRVNGTYTEYTAIRTSSTQFSNVKLTYGPAQDYASGSTTRVYNPITSTRENLLIDGLAGDSGILNLDGSLKNASITNAKVADGSITTTKLSDGNVTVTKLSSDLVGAWQVWTPTFTNFSLGSGTCDSKYIQIGKTVHFRINVTLNSSTVGSGVAFSLPVTGNSSLAANEGMVIGHARFLDAGLAAYYGVCKIFSTTVAEIRVFIGGNSYLGANAVTSTAPFTWGNGDAFMVTGTYEAA